MPRTKRPDPLEEVHDVQRLFARERLSIDDMQPGRTCFLSHIGAQPRLVPGPWIGHRDLLYALALANLTPAQRTSLARAVLVEYGRQFGVGRLQLEALASGLPLGGSSVLMRHRKGGPVCLYTWALGAQATPAACDWLLLRAQPEWALDDPPPPLATGGLQALVELGGEVIVLVASAVGAVQIAAACAKRVVVAAHPRFSPHIEGLDPEAPVLLWPHDALDGAGLRRRKVAALVLVGAPEHVRQEAEAWAKRAAAGRSGPHPIGDDHDDEASQARTGRSVRPSLRSGAAGPHLTPEIVDVACPGRAARPQLASFWEACGRPRVLLTGDPAWASVGAQWLESLGATVVVHTEATQLELL